MERSNLLNGKRGTTAGDEVSLQCMNRLGDSSIDRRVHLAAVLGRGIELGREDAPVVRPFIADTARRVKRGKRGRSMREPLLDIDMPWPALA